MLSPPAVLTPITPDHPGFLALLAQSRAEDHNMLLRFAENWHSGANRFTRPGELILGATSNGTLAGICGRNIDPYDPLRALAVFATSMSRPRAAATASAAC